ncbi:MAG: glycosyl hydrolase, partial [Acidobacteriaceae bacterium]
VTRYLTRMSWLLRQGKPANQVAVLLPEADAQANFNLREDSVSDQMGKLLGADLEPQILDAGYNFDYIDSAAIDRVGIHYPVLVLPSLTRLPLAAYRKIQDYTRSGGIVIAIGTLPSRAPGFLESPRDTAAVEQISRELFSPDAKNAKRVDQTSDLGAALHVALPPDVALDPATPAVGFIRRRLADADLYFLANTDNHPHTITATFHTGYKNAAWWNPFDGTISDAGASPSIRMTLAPYESRVLVFSDRPLPQKSAGMADFPPLDLSHGWTVRFDRTGATRSMQTLHSWADDPAEKYYSGTATYTRSVNVSAGAARAGVVMLDFGVGTPVERATMNFPGTRTWLDAPLRDAAQVYVNGTLAGSVWHPPFTLDIARWLHPGSNQLKIVVANTAINELAGRAAPDYRLLWERYGKRFTPQDMDHLQPLPSGILGPLRIVSKQDAEPEVP